VGVRLLSFAERKVTDLLGGQASVTFPGLGYPITYRLHEIGRLEKRRDCKHEV